MSNEIAVLRALAETHSGQLTAMFCVMKVMMVPLRGDPKLAVALDVVLEESRVLMSNSDTPELQIAAFDQVAKMLLDQLG